MWKKKTPNYLYTIIWIIATMISLILILAIFVPLPEREVSPTDLLNLNISGKKIVSKNFISYTKNSQPKIGNNSPIWGDNDRPITIFEYVNFGCEYSAKLQTNIDELKRLYPEKIQVVWKDLPEANSQLAHRASRCAQQQNKFWEYTDLVWQIDNDFSKQNLLAIANELNLNQNEFELCLDDQTVIDFIKEDMAEADELEIYGTPHLYINDQELVGLTSLEDMRALIELELIPK